MLVHGSSYLSINENRLDVKKYQIISITESIVYIILAFSTAIKRGGTILKVKGLHRRLFHTFNSHTDVQSLASRGKSHACSLYSFLMFPVKTFEIAWRYQDFTFKRGLISIFT